MSVWVGWVVPVVWAAQLWPNGLEWPYSVCLEPQLDVWSSLHMSFILKEDSLGTFSWLHNGFQQQGKGPTNAQEMYKPLLLLHLLMTHWPKQVT